MPSEQALKGIERRKQEVRLAKEYGVDPKQLEGMSQSQIDEYFGQVRAALADAKAKAKAKKKTKRSNELDGKDVAKRLKSKLNQIRKKHGNPLELSINQFQRMKSAIMRGTANAIKRSASNTAKAVWDNIGKTPTQKVRQAAIKARDYLKSQQTTSGGTNKKRLVGAGLAGAGLASVIPPANREKHETQAKEMIKRYR